MMDLREWLTQHGLESCAEILVENEVDFDVLSELQEADLEKIGLALGPRKRLLKAIRELDRSRLTNSGESPNHRADSFGDSGASNLECDLHSDMKRHRGAAARSAKAAPRALLPFLMVLGICAAAALGWAYYRNLQQYAQTEKSYTKLMNLAQASAVKLRFDEAENFYARAYELSEQLDRSHKQDLLNAKAANYTKLLVTPYRDAVYSVRGTVWTRSDNPLGCVGGLAACGYRFKPDDQGRIFGSRADIIITTGAGQRLPLRNGMRVSEIFPVGGDVCCAYSRKAAVPQLTFSIRSGSTANVYVSQNEKTDVGRRRASPRYEFAQEADIRQEHPLRPDSGLNRTFPVSRQSAWKSPFPVTARLVKRQPGIRLGRASSQLPAASLRELGRKSSFVPTGL